MEVNAFFDKVLQFSHSFFDEIISHNRYYENLPSGWVICSLSTIANIFNGNSINEQEKSKKYTGLLDGYNYIGTKDVSSNHTVNYDNGVKIPYNNQFKIAHKGTPLLCIEGGSAGRKICFLQEDVCFGNKLCALESYGINNNFLYYFLQSSIFKDVFKKNTQGIIGGVSINTIKALPFCMPPLLEQQRIVNRVEELLVHVYTIETNQPKLEQLYDDLKKKTLDLAIRGKLVSQDPNDEPASELLKRIRTEKKAKLGKKYVDSYIYKGDDNCYYEHIDGKTDDEPIEVPYDLPKNWCWSRIEIIFDLQAGKFIAADKISDMQDSVYKYPCYGGNGLRGYVENYNYEGLYPLIGRQGALCGNINRAVGKFYATEHAVTVTSYCNMVINIVCVFLQAMNLNQYSTATAQPGLAVSKINKLLFPVPPLAEQQRIVNRINEIFAKL